MPTPPALYDKTHDWDQFVDFQYDPTGIAMRSPAQCLPAQATQDHDIEKTADDKTRRECGGSHNKA
ncbi:MAG: hypothetical protein HYT41_01620 [Candidatus Sungbacteria bacterium]|nr:hypothetical protein [Candidatus Sungbacteria bacterium]